MNLSPDYVKNIIEDMHTIQVCLLFSAPVKKYTDDTAMTKSIAESLIAQERFDALDIAKR